ncbi:hypothetical protein INT45_013674 [Circinella minor]|uniref:Kelch repeat-containing protein n=1 Tax=Circinella minor TaxID=1195481 RepID=A0A8H7VQZ6_9FUNG|nr:hypothetical protein INT45_013674 [Circinella minor]
MAVIPSRNSFIMTGGRGHSKGQQLSVLYDANNNIWKNETDNDLRDFYDSHTAVAKNDLVYVGGGRRIVGDNLTVDEIFPQSIRILRFDARYWRSPKATLSRLSIDIRLHHKSVLGSDGKTIYYVGGMYTAPPGPVSYDDYRYEYVPMNNILTFDTDTETWNNISTKGLIPSGRIDHSLTLTRWVFVP